MSNTAPSRADPVVVFPFGRWCPPQETSQPHPPQNICQVKYVYKWKGTANDRHYAVWSVVYNDYPIRVQRNSGWWEAEDSELLIIVLHWLLISGHNSNTWFVKCPNLAVHQQYPLVHQPPPCALLAGLHQVLVCSDHWYMAVVVFGHDFSIYDHVSLIRPEFL